MRATNGMVRVTILEVIPILDGVVKGLSVKGANLFGDVNPKIAAQGFGSQTNRA